MMQSFEAEGGPHLGRAHVPKLRKTLVSLKLDGLIVPHEDEYQNEYVPPAFDRLAWLTGFTGSAGAAIVMLEQAVMFVDGRYTLQARVQVDGKLFAFEDLRLGPAGWIERDAPKGARIGFDPKLLSPDALARLSAAAEKAGVTLEAVSPNPIDLSWGDKRPLVPQAPVRAHPEAFAGESAESKRRRLSEALAKDGLEVAILSSPASIAWLFNIRGGDVLRAPMPLGAAFLYADGAADLFLDPKKVDPDLLRWLGPDVSVRPESDLPAAFSDLGGKHVRLDPATTSAWFFDQARAAGVDVSPGPDPVMIPRACKNAVEIDGARRAHVRDGAALTRFLHWLDTHAQSGKVDEIEACTVLERFRAESNELLDLSFDSIAAAGPNGAFVHYRVNTKTNRKLKRGSLFLIDSGGQYLDGTTDVTRTVPIGRPTAEMRDRFTRVLKGHIALARLRFPAGTTGAAIDAIARAALWEAGLDYEHGTGHGVGSYLSVHEGPQRIAKGVSSVPLQPGMIVSNEPGYYKTGEYGIRIENLQVVTPPAPIEGGDLEMLGFETLTRAPIARALIDLKSLSKTERNWINEYHADVSAALTPLLAGEALEWMGMATRPL